VFIRVFRRPFLDGTAAEMKIARAPHRWSLTPKQAIAVQQRLREHVSTRPMRASVRLIAGVDAAFSPDGARCIGGVVLWDAHAGAVLEEHTAQRPLVFPYVPGLLSFRETPTLLAALRKLRCTPDLLMCDGHGLAHPRRFGIACHLGVLTGLPSLGCAKSRLVGSHAEVGERRGARAPLLHRDEEIGSVLRTQSGVRPVFVSVGHGLEQHQAERLVLAAARRYRLPEPTRLADQLVARAKRALRG
jgi:deoxyribonuclease V